MCDYEDPVERGVGLLEGLAHRIGLSDDTLRFTVDKGWLVKIEALTRFRACRPAKQQGMWRSSATPTSLLWSKLNQHLSSDLENVLTSLPGDYGFVEAEFKRGKVASITIRMALCPPSRCCA
jgi:hypothetical protein